MKCCSVFRGLMTATSLLLPSWAAAESHLQAAPQSGKVSATAHVDLRIVIPKMLSLGVGGDTHGPGVQTVAIFSNSRNVTLAASTGSIPAARNNVILRAAAGKVIEREAACQLPADAIPSMVSQAKAKAKVNAMICTASMP